MNRQFRFNCKVAAGLCAALLVASVGVAADAPIVCLDISGTPTAKRVLKLAATPAGPNYFSLAGAHRNQDGVTVGSAVGTGLLEDGQLIINANATSFENAIMKSTQYQFNLATDAATARWLGVYQSITQQSSEGALIPMTTFASGKAALADCDNDQLTVFSGTTPSPESCLDLDQDNDSYAKCRMTLLGPMPYDCDDTAGTVHPDAVEVCGNNIDDDCDGKVDNCTATVDNDLDNDGYDSKASGGADCDDSNASVKPGATEVCADLIDNDCDGVVNDGCTVVDNDLDNDGYDSKASGGTDCDDNNASVKPGATEVCADLIDNDCDGVVNEGCTVVTPPAFPSFTDNKNGTLSQVGTNLVWQQVHYDPATSGGLKLTWKGAVSYCNDLTLGGSSNWRLPTKTELEGILDSRRSPVQIDRLFTGAQAEKYVTNTLVPTAAGYVYEVHFGSGETLLGVAESPVDLIRCVR